MLMHLHVKNFALIEEADHMYNNYLVDLYKVTGNYVLDILNHRRSPLKKEFTPEEEALMLANEAMMDEDDDE